MIQAGCQYKKLECVSTVLCCPVHDLDLFLCQSIKFVDGLINLAIGGFDLALDTD